MTRSRPGRYAELDAGQLADVVERVYGQGETPDWELVFEFTRRTLAAEADQVDEAGVNVSRSA